MTSHPNTRDPMLPQGSDKCKCTICHEYFNSTNIFDLHRRSIHGKGKAPKGQYQNRCLTIDEMTAKGYAKNTTGHWCRPDNRLKRVFNIAA